MKNQLISTLPVLSKKAFLILLFTTIVLVACSDDDEKVRIETLIIAPELVLTGTNPQTDILVKVMEATKANSTQKYYIPIGMIEGFEYEEGYEYKIKVRITSIKNPPMDGHTETFKFIELILKRR